MYGSTGGDPSILKSPTPSITSEACPSSKAANESAPTPEMTREASPVSKALVDRSPVEAITSVTVPSKAASAVSTPAVSMTRLFPVLVKAAAAIRSALVVMTRLFPELMTAAAQLKLPVESIISAPVPKSCVSRRRAPQVLMTSSAAPSRATLLPPPN